jgi:SpoVK/Ycf46/Vps4 family AAA+-type ATPase
MYTEIIKIIEGGLKKDTKKVYGYSKLLADELKRNGEGKLAETILAIIGKNFATTVSMDELLSTPVDQESRLDIADVFLPTDTLEKIILPKSVDEKVQEFVNAIKHKDNLRSYGLTTYSTLLLYGAPGGGKTSIAKKISVETGLPLIIARFDAIVSSLLGNTAKNIRKIFEFADNKPCILFLDEFDAIAKARDDQYELGELKRVINSLIQNIDQFSQENILIAATNHQELLDRAIWRRFNTVIEVGYPGENEIKDLVSLFLNNYDTTVLKEHKQLEVVVKLLSGKSPSDIKNILHNTIANCVINNKHTLEFLDILMGIYHFNNHGETNLETVVKYLYQNGINQSDIAERNLISLRQLRNYLNKQ